jgi:hypothetical protein
MLIYNFSFNRIKKGYPFEVELICGVLPNLLTDFFPPSEIMTKVIGDFLSTQQPHPRLLAAVLFQVTVVMFIAVGHLSFFLHPQRQPNAFLCLAFI